MDGDDIPRVFQSEEFFDSFFDFVQQFFTDNPEPADPNDFTKIAITPFRTAMCDLTSRV